jgi:hypothetical protein
MSSFSVLKNNISPTWNQVIWFTVLSIIWGVMFCLASCPADPEPICTDGTITISIQPRMMMLIPWLVRLVYQAGSQIPVRKSTNPMTRHATPVSMQCNWAAALEFAKVCSWWLFETPALKDTIRHFVDHFSWYPTIVKCTYNVRESPNASHPQCDHQCVCFFNHPQMVSWLSWTYHGLPY